MKKSIFSVLLAICVAVVTVASVIVLPAAAAADVNLIGVADPNDTKYATVNTNTNGSVTATVKKSWNSVSDAAYGMAVTTFLGGYDVSKTPYAHVDIVCDVPFRVSILDRSPTRAYDDRWITFGNEFFDTFVANGGAPLTGAPDGLFFPAGTYQCALFLKGYYDYKGIRSDNVNAAYIYIELKEQGTATLNTFKLSASSVFTPTILTEPTTTTTTMDENMTWGDPQTLLPPSAGNFSTIDGGGGAMTVTASGGGYRFASSKGYPQAYYTLPESDWVAVNVAEETYLHYDFEVVSGKTNIYIYFQGQSPIQQAAPGAGTSLNVLINPNNLDANGNVIDLPVGRYQGKFHVSDLGCADSLMSDGTFSITGIKAFAVGGTTVINSLYVSSLEESSTVSTAPVDTYGEQITYTVESKEASAGETVTVDVSVSDNHYMTNGQFTVSYDASKLRLKTASTNSDNPYVSAVNTAIFPSSYYVASAQPQEGRVKVAFVTSSAIGQAVGGTMFRLTFEVIGGSTGKAAVTLAIPELFSCNGTLNGGAAYSTNYRVVDGGVSVVNGAVQTASTTQTTDTTKATTTTAATATTVVTTASTVVSTTSSTAATTAETSPTMAQEVVYAVDSATAVVGDVVTLPIYVSDYHYIVNGQIRIHFDPSALEIRTVTTDADNPYFADVNTNILHDAVFVSGLPANGVAKAAFLSQKSKGSAGGGVIATVSFRLLAEGTFPVTVSAPELYANDGITNDGKDVSKTAVCLGGVVSAVRITTAQTTVTSTETTVTSTETSATETTVTSTETSATEITVTSTETSATATETTTSTTVTETTESTTVTTTSTTEAAPTKGNGDTDGNDTVNIQDAVMCYYHVNGKTTLSAEAQARADVAVPQGTLNIQDAVMIYYFVNGKTDIG